MRRTRISFGLGILVLISALSWPAAPLAAAAQVPRVSEADVSAHPYDDAASNHGALANPWYGGLITTLDGIRAHMQVSNLQAVTSCGASTTNGPTCRAMEGGNLRPLQIVATSPPEAVVHGEFVAYSYGVGCFDNGDCSGPTGSTSGSYRERSYIDGNNRGNYYFNWREDVSVGTNPNYEIIWYGGWQYFKDGVHQGTTGNLMRRGYGTIGSETEALTALGPATNKVLAYGAVWQQKVEGGWWGNVGQAGELEPHAPACNIAVTVGTGYGTIVEVNGSC